MIKNSLYELPVKCDGNLTLRRELLLIAGINNVMIYKSLHDHIKYEKRVHNPKENLWFIAR
jgi:hypothetical protein